MARRVVALLLLLGLVGLVGILLYATRPSTVTRVVERQVERRLEGSGRRARVGPARLDTASGRVLLKDFRITEPDGQTPFLVVPRLTVDLAVSDTPGQTVLRQVTLEGPSIHIVKQGKRFNFSDLLERNGQPGNGRLDVLTVQVFGASATYRDPAQQLTVQLSGLDLLAQGSLARRDAGGTYTAQRVVINRRGRKLELKRIHGKVRLTGDKLTFDLEASGQGARITGDALVHLDQKPVTYQGRFKLAGLPLEQVSQATGTADLWGQVQGRGGAWRASAQGQAKGRLRYPFSAQTRLSLAPGKFALAGGRFQWGPVSGTLSGNQDALRLTATSAQWPPEPAVGLSGARLTATMRHPLSRPTWQALLTVQTLALGNQRLKRVTASAHGSGQDNWPFQLSWRLPRQPLSTPPDWLIETEGQGRVTGAFGQAWASWRAEATFTPAIHQADELILASQGQVRLGWRRGALHVDQMRLAGRAGEVRVHGTLAPFGSSSLTASGTLDSALAALIWPKTLADAAGVIPFEARLTGEPGRHQGRLAILGASLSSRGLPQDLSEVRAELVLAGDTLAIRPSSARLNQEGSVAVQGQIRLAGLRPRQLALEGRARNLWLGGPGYRGEVDADLLLIGSPSSPLLSGEVRLDRATYFRDFPIGLAHVLERPVPQPPQTRPLGPWRLNVLVTGPGALHIDNRQADLTILGDLRVIGTVQAPRLIGRAEAVEGTVQWQGQRYRLERGTLEWFGGRPYFDVALSSRIGTYQVSVAASGQQGDLTLDLTSRPPLSALDILALMSTGRTGEQLQEQPLAALRLLAPELLSGLTTGLEQTLGLDLVAVRPEPGAALGQLVIGKQLSERLEVELSQSLQNPTERELQFQYQVTPQFAVRVEQQSDGQYRVTIQMERRIR